MSLAFSQYGSQYGLAVCSLAVLVMLGCGASYLDARYRRIPNLLCLAVLILGLASAFAIGGPIWAGWCLLHAAVALVIGMVLFKFDLIGGGDGKFYAATAAWLPLYYWGALALSISLSGLGLVLIWIFGGKRFLVNVSGNDSIAFAKVPYGIAIALGGSIAFAFVALRT